MIRPVEAGLAIGIAGILLVPAGPLAAQEKVEPAPEGGRSALLGRVVVDGTNRPLPGFVVELLRQEALVLTDSTGAFRFTGLQPGWDTLRVRSLDFEGEKVAVRLAPGAVHSVELAVAYPMAALEELVVQVRDLHRERMAGFDGRRKAGMGRYITREDIEERRPVWLAQLFWRVPGTWVRGREVFLRSRGRTSLGTRPESIFGLCRPTILVNGARQTVIGLDDIAPDRVEAIEVYRSPFIPGPFRDPFNDCGVIVIWTRTWRGAT